MGGFSAKSFAVTAFSVAAFSFGQLAPVPEPPQESSGGGGAGQIARFASDARSDKRDLGRAKVDSPAVAKSIAGLELSQEYSALNQALAELNAAINAGKSAADKDEQKLNPLLKAAAIPAIEPAQAAHQESNELRKINNLKRAAILTALLLS